VTTNSDQIVALVTGGASGVGQTIAESFLENGAAVHICDANTDNIANFLQTNPTASASPCDVSDAAQVESVFKDLLSHHGRLDVLINNAGIAGPTAAAEDIETEDWDQCMNVNISGAFYFARNAIPLIKQQEGGVIINISSTAGLMGCPNRSPYVASKWGLIGLTKTWAMELGPHNIRANAICPTCVEGERIERVIESDAKNRGLTNDEIRDVYQRQTSMRLFVTGEDVAQMVQFLVSPNAAKISGQVISVDGNTETLANWLDS